MILLEFQTSVLKDNRMNKLTYLSTKINKNSSYAVLINRNLKLTLIYISLKMKKSHLRYKDKGKYISQVIANLRI